MRIFIKTICFALAGIILPAYLFAQDKKDVKMADVMRDNGMIYVVVAVVVTILIGLLLYMVRLDRKIRELEKED